MERTITLSEETYRALQHQASRSQKTVDVLVLADLAQNLGVEDLAEQHDHYLYGTEKR